MAKVASIMPSPTYNAVNITVNNPKLNVANQSQNCEKCTSPIYDYPKAPIYEASKADKKEEIKK